MLKNCTRLECIVNEKVGHFYCDMDTPLVVAKEMIFQFQKYIGLVEDQLRAQEDQKKSEEADQPIENNAQDDCCSGITCC